MQSHCSLAQGFYIGILIIKRGFLLKKRRGVHASASNSHVEGLREFLNSLPLYPAQRCSPSLRFALPTPPDLFCWPPDPHPFVLLTLRRRRARSTSSRKTRTRKASFSLFWWMVLHKSRHCIGSLSKACSNQTCQTYLWHILWFLLHLLLWLYHITQWYPFLLTSHQTDMM